MICTVMEKNLMRGRHLIQRDLARLRHQKRYFSSQTKLATDDANEPSSEREQLTNRCPIHHETRAEQIFNKQKQQCGLNQLQYKPFEAIPGPRPSIPGIGTNWSYLPFIGHLRSGSDRLHLSHKDKFAKYGPICREEVTYKQPSVSLYNPADIKRVLLSEIPPPPRPPFNYLLKHRRANPDKFPNVGLAFSEGEEWRDLRSRLSPLFLSSEAKERAIHSQNLVTKRLMDYIDFKRKSCDPEKQEIVEDVQDVITRFSIESITTLSVGPKISCLSPPKASLLSIAERDGEILLETVAKFFKAQGDLYHSSRLSNWFNNTFKELCESHDLMHATVGKYVQFRESNKHSKTNQEKSEQINQESLLNEPLIQTLHDRGYFTDSANLKEAITDFIIGGSYPLSTTLTLNLFTLACNPEAQEKIYEELKTVIGDKDALDDFNLDEEKLEKLQYLKLCVKETQRMMPSISGISRITQKDLILSGYHVPKNTYVYCDLMTTCNLSQYFDEPDQFRPERWQRGLNGRENALIKNPDLAFLMLPFGFGVRKCIGKKTSDVQFRMPLARLVSKYKFEPMDDLNLSNLDLISNLVISPRDPFRLKFKLRE